MKVLGVDEIFGVEFGFLLDHPESTTNDLTNLQTHFTDRPTAMASRSVSIKCLRLSASASPSYAFLQLAPARSISTKSAFHPPLDFLLPNVAIQKQRPGYKSVITSPRTQRGFSSSQSRRATVTVVNPRKDDDGNQMTIEITPRASNVSLRSSGLQEPAVTELCPALERNNGERLES